MQEIHCHIPITLRITGRPNDAQLDALGEKIAHAVKARIAAAERLIAERRGGHAHKHEIARDAWKPTQADPSHTNYEIASYKGPPKTRIKVQGKCRLGHVLGQGEFVPDDEFGRDLLYYRIWGAWKTGDTLKSFGQRLVNAWIPWRFGPLAPQDRRKVSDHLFTSLLEKFEGGGVGEPGCDYAIVLSKDVWRKAVELSGEPRRLAELARVRKEFATKPGERPDFAKATVAQRLILLEERIRLFWTGNKDEEEIIQILKSTRPDQAAELSRRLSTDRLGDETFFAALDRVVDLGNNLELHVELTKLHLLGLGTAKGVKAILEDALTLPWHDVMGVGHDVPVTFSVRAGAGGAILIKYNASAYLFNTDMPFQDELDALPLSIKIGGIAFDGDQLFKVHDWDEGKFVIVRARDLLAYQNIGIRNWLGHVATVASFVIPGGAATSTAGKVALFAIEKAIPLLILAVRENRLSLVKWFPKWGPRMIFFADVAELAIGVYGLASFARSGVKFFNSWREARFARKLWDAAESVDEAEKAAIRIESEADKILNAVDEFKQVEAAVGHTKPAGPPLELPAGPPASRSVAAGAGPQSRAAVRARAPNGVSEDTISMLQRNPELLEALEHNPRAAKALTLCKSPCIPEFASKEQVRRIERMLEQAEAKGAAINQKDLRNVLHEASNQAELTQKIDAVEAALKNKIEQLEAIASSKAYDKLFEGLGKNWSKAQKARVSRILDEAEGAEIYLSREKTEELRGRLSKLRTSSEIERELSALEHSLTEAKGVKAQGVTGPKAPRPREPTSTDVIRATTGAPTGGEKLPAITENWIMTGTGPLKNRKFYGLLPIPGQIAARLRRLHFNDFAEFRQTFWKLVAADAKLAGEFSYDARNLNQMRNGRPPFAPGPSVAGVKEWKEGLANIVYQIDHKVPLEMGGGLFDLDNLQVVSKRVHDVLGS
jgi:hypothetical protein